MGTVSSRFRGPREFTALHALLAVGAVLALVVIGVVALAPRKPPAPPPSRVAYPPVEESRIEPPETFADVDPELPSWMPQDEELLERMEEHWREQGGQVGDRIEVYGTVTEKDTGKPVRFATVSCTRRWSEEEIARWHDPAFVAELEDSADPDAPTLEQRLDSKRAAQTDEQGRYRFTASMPGEFLFSVQHERYLDAVNVTKTVSEGVAKVRIDFQLDRGASISGRITERGTGRPAAGILIVASGSNVTEAFVQDAYAQTRSGADGRYALFGLPPGAFDVQLELLNRPYRFAGLPPVRTVRIEHVNHAVRDVDFVLDAAGVVWGYVTDPEGNPARGIHVIQCNSDSVVSQVVEAAMQMRPPLGATTDQEGFYRMAGVPLNRECRVYAFPGTLAPQLSEPFILTETRREARVDVFLDAGTTVYGRVLSTADRAVIPGADIVCLPGIAKLTTPFDAPAGIRETQSKEDGSFTLPHLPPGQHRLFATKEGFKFSLTGEPIFSDGHNDLAADIWLTPVDSGEHSVYGTVTDGSNRPVAGARVSLAVMAFDEMSGQRETQTDESGYFAFTGVDEALRMLRVEAEGYAPENVTDVRLDGPTNVVLESQGGVRGKVVVRESGRPPQPCTVRAIPALVFDAGLPEGFGGSTNTESSGSFNLPLPAGTYTLVASAPGLVPGKTAVEVEAGEITRDVVIYLSERGAAIRGRVVTRDGKSPAGATVQIGSKGASFAGLEPLIEQNEIRPQTVGEDGRFEFAPLAAGAYVLSAQLTGYAQALAGPIEVEEGKVVSGVELTLGSGGVLRGTVTIAGEVAPGAVVTVVGNGISRVATADHNGQYVLENLPEGVYLASAMAPDALASGNFAPSHGQVEIREGQTTVYNFGQQGGATVEGFCQPPPPSGKLAFAVLRVAGMGPDVAQLDLRDMLSWFASGDIESAAAYIVGFASVDRDGYFRIDNAPPGEYVLDVMYVDLGMFMSRGGRQAFSAPVSIVDDQPVQLDIQIP